MGGDNGNRPFKIRKAEIISSIAVLVAAPVALYTWQLRGSIQELVELERVKTTKQIKDSRAYTDKRIAEFYREFKEDFGEIKDRISELRSDVREIRVEVIRGYKK